MTGTAAPVSVLGLAARNHALSELRFTVFVFISSIYVKNTCKSRYLFVHLQK
jgi:hypothetical protein